MQKAVINIGDKIELTHVKSEFRSRLSKRRYGSKLLDYDGVRSAKIAMPIYEGKVIPLQVGDEYDLCFLRQRVSTGAVQRFQTVSGKGRCM